MAGIGYMLQRIGQNQQEARKNQARDDYLKTQKKVMDAQWKAMEAKQAFMDANPDVAKRQYMSKEGRLVDMLKDLLKPQTQGQPEQPPGQTGPPGNMVEQSPRPEGTPMGQSMQGQQGPQGLSDIISQGRTNPQIRMILEQLKMGPEALKYIETTGPSGGPARQGVDPMSGKPYGEPISGAISLTPQKRTDAQGNEHVVWMNPYTGKEMNDKTPVSPGASQTMGTMTAPVKPKTVEIMEKGVTYEKEINPYTGEQIPGTKVRKKREEKDVAAESAGKIALAQTGLNELKNVIDGFTDKDGSWNNQALIGAEWNAPDLPLISEDMKKGRTAKQAWRRGVDGIIRAATGAAIPESEWKFYESAYLPTYLDSDEAKANKMIAFESFLNNYLDILDPTKRMRIKFKIPNRDKYKKKSIKPTDLNKPGKFPVGMQEGW